MTDQQLNFPNVVPVFLNDPDFTVSEIRRQYRDVGLRHCVMCPIVAKSPNDAIV